MSAPEFGTRLLDTRELAAGLHVSPRTVEDWRLTGDGPPFVRLSGRAVRYRPAAVRQWLAAREMRSTSEVRR